MNKLRNYFLLLKNKSLRYILFRLLYEIKRKSGLLISKFHKNPPYVKLPNLENFRNNRFYKYLFDNREHLHIPQIPSDKLKDDFLHIMNGDILFFSYQWIHLGLDYDWVTNYDSGYHYDNTVHWSKLESLSSEEGDIKFVWEKSRFLYLYTIIRYDYHFKEDHSEFVLNQILDWIDKNPLNCGPNYICSQEISLRVQNWIFALNFYKKSSALTEERWNKIIKSIYWQIEHVYRNIDFSRISVRNNHAITETMTLYLIGLLFPSFPNAEKWKRDGKRWFEQEIDYQIENDGTYLQNSMNYHRVVVQLMTMAIALADKNGDRFNDFVYDKAYQSVNFLYQCQDEFTGWLPNYGANDGALFFPLNNNDYRDYRPQLDTLHKLLTNQDLYEERFEDSYWFNGDIRDRKTFDKIIRKQGIVEFPISGYYLIRDGNTLSFIRCGRFKKDGTNDQLHLDVWCDGKNVLMDCGSYKYNTTLDYQRYFAGTESHNTIMLEDYDQMLKGPHFMWFYPTKVIDVRLNEYDNCYEFVGKIQCYRYLRRNITYKRIVRKTKNTNEWIIEDIVLGKTDNQTIRQLWHKKTDVKNIIVESLSDNVLSRELDKWESSYYGMKRDCKQLEFSTQSDTINTKIIIS